MNWLASLALRDKMGTLSYSIVGVLSALICGFVVSLLLPVSFVFTTFNGESLVITFLGAFIVLLVFRSCVGQRAPS